MSFYQRLADVGRRFIPEHILLKYALNLSPMYTRSTASITHVAKDLSAIRLKIPLSYRNSNYVGSIFGGSMFSATDPIPMVQLIQLLGNNYVVWDKSAQIFFRKPARETLVCECNFSSEEMEEIRSAVSAKNEIDYLKTLNLTDVKGETTFCQVQKVIYIADKDFYKEKLKAKDVQSDGNK